MKKLFFLFLALVIVGCQNNSSNHEKQLRLNLRSDPTTLDPRKGGDLISTELQMLLFEGLTRLSPDGKIELAQAERVDISRDQTIYTFHLRKAQWSSGAAVSAFDFEKSWKDVLDPGFPAVSAYL